MIIHSHFGHHRLLTRSKATGAESRQANDRNISNENPRPTESGQASRSSNAEMQLSRAERQQVNELRARDSAVRAHEQAHLAAAGRFASGGPSFEYRRGPDGRQYATGGEIKIDTSPVSGDPQATLQKAHKIRQAALAPATPSAQDKAVAARASRMAAEAQAELMQERAEMRSQDSAQNTDEADGESGTSAKHNSEETLSPCSACGGRHSSDAHSALQIYTSHERPESPSDIGSLITRNA